MKWFLATACAAALSMASVVGADAKGCIKGAVVGGVAATWLDTENWVRRQAA